jgi:rhomboid protease GluP
MFIHIGFTHILVNSITLYYLGTQMESLYGSLRFALIYLLSGLMGNLMSFAFNDSISAGASTSLFGLFAAAIVLGRQFPYNLGIQQMARSFTMLIFLNFFFGFFSTAVDNFGHLGGALGGALAAVFIAMPRTSKSQNGQRLLFLIIYFVNAIFFAYTGFMRAGFALY